MVQTNTHRGYSFATIESDQEMTSNHTGLIYLVTFSSWKIVFLQPGHLSCT